jgi:putative restriction endonuclease
MAIRIFGEITGIHEGATFKSRITLSEAGIHRPTQAGISGSSKEGSDSIVISGGYEDDTDHGDEIIYTGHGGRDLNTGKQNANQHLDRGNKALAISCKNHLPVRVIRKTEYGYRYDGLYQVKEFWQAKGKSGYLVYRFRLTKEQ